MPGRKFKGLKNLLIEADYGLKNGLLNAISSLFFKAFEKNSSISKIIVFRTGSIGDSICALPALSAIVGNFPDATIDLLTNAGSADFISLDKLINKSKFNEIINYYGLSKIELYKKLQTSQYDLFIDLTQYDATLSKQLKILLFAKQLGVKYAFGWRVSQTFLFKQYQEKNKIFTNERDRLLDILKANGLEIDNPKYIYDQNPEISAGVQKIIWDKTLANKNLNIGLVIGSKLERNKWPLDYFKQVADHYTDQEYRILVFGGKEDRVNAESLTSDNTMHNKRVFNFCGVFSPLETAQAMKFCAVVLTNDTGPMHLSYMTDTPVVALFSSRDFPGKWYPPQDGVNKVFRSENIACSICIGKGCSDNICMKKISPEKVIEAIDAIVN